MKLQELLYKIQGLQTQIDALASSASVAALQAQITALDAQVTTLDTMVGPGSIVTLLSYQAQSAVGSRTSAAFGDYPGPHDLVIVKKFSAAASKLVVFGTIGAYASTVTLATVGLSFGGVDHTVGTFFFNATGQHGLLTCQDDTFSSLGVGTLTGRVRWHSDGANQINTDANDAVRLTLLEVLL